MGFGGFGGVSLSQQRAPLDAPDCSEVRLELMNQFEGCHSAGLGVSARSVGVCEHGASLSRFFGVCGMRASAADE